VIGVEEFRAEVRGWLADNLVGDFAALKGLGAPGREDEGFEERRAWNQLLATAGLTCLGWPVEHGGRGLSIAHRVAFYGSTPARTHRTRSTTSARNCSGRH
jgi:alkylation response protein AidB-like acyl-CoA dehydrogenase